MKYDLKYMQELIKHKGRCLSLHYSGGQKMTWECLKGHIWKTYSYHVRSGSWCPKCANDGRNPYKYSLESMQKIAFQHGGLCLSQKYNIYRMRWKCSNGHIWETRPYHIQKGHWCAICSYSIRGKKRRKYNIEDMQTLAQNRNGLCLSIQYLGSGNNLEWECSDGHQWSAPPDRILRGCWCSKCAKRKHFTEEKCRHIIEQMTGLQFPSNRVVLGGRLEIDLYNTDLKVGIEYNGIQHYKFVKGWHKTLEGLLQGQKRDEIKRNRCKTLGIDLHIVSYKDSQSDEKLVSALKDIVLICKIPLIKDSVNFSEFYKKLSSLSDLKKLARDRGGQCLSIQYINCETKCQFQCKKGHIFVMEPRHVKSGHWCRECGFEDIGDKNRKLTIEDAQKEAVSRGGKCLSKAYKSSSTKIKWECAKGHIWEATFNGIRSGDWCSVCGHESAGKKMCSSIERVQEHASFRGGQCLSDVYVNNSTKLEFECSEGHRWWARPGNIQQGKWCPKCKYI